MRKNRWGVLVLSLCAGTFLAAEDLDTKIKQAVDTLVASQKTQVTVRITAPTITGTSTTSGFSRYLYEKIDFFAVQNRRFKVIQGDPVGFQDRSMPRVRLNTEEQQAVIETSFFQSPDYVEVSLRLVLEAEGGKHKIEAAAFKVSLEELQDLGIEMLPANRKTEEEVKNQEQLFNEVLEKAPVIQGDEALRLEAWLNEKSRTYIDSQTMTISLWASKDCYVQVYHIDVYNQMKLIYPNSFDLQNFLPSQQTDTIPKKTNFVLCAPYGDETILVIASEKPFANADTQLVPVTRESLAEIRGISISSKAVYVRLNYTILSKPR
jgi:hypothetical protein